MDSEIAYLFPEKEELRELIAKWADEHAEEFLEQMEELGEEIKEVAPADAELLEKHLDEYFVAVKNKLKRFNKKYSKRIGTKSSKASKARVTAKIERQISASLNKLEAREQERLYQNLDKPRQEAAGVTNYVWVTRGDGRVRKTHRENNAKVFSWDAPSDETGHPGHDWGCRCRALPKILPVENVREGIEMVFFQELITEINDSSRWYWSDFFNHYFFGEGRSVTLEKMGHLGEVITESKNHVFRGVEDQVSELALLIQDGNISDSFNNSYNFDAVSIAHGNSTVYGQFEGTVKRFENKNGYSLNVNVEVEYNFFDIFTDPLSKREQATGTSNPDDATAEELEDSEIGGKLYEIIGKWQTKLTGTMKVSNKN